jgi:hypothetical protein
MANNCLNYIELHGGEVSLKPLAKTFVELDNSTDEYEGLHGSNYWKLMDFTYPKYGEKDFDVYTEYGSKWFAFSLDEYNEESNYMRITGDSAWSPVIALVQKLAKFYKIKNAYIEYEESGCDFAGSCTINSKGETIEEEQHSYKVWCWKQGSLELEEVAHNIVDWDISIFEFYLENKDLFKLFNTSDIEFLVNEVNNFKKDLDD